MYGDLPELTSADGLTAHGFPYRIPNSPTGPKTCVLRLPTPDELSLYMGALRNRVRLLGNRKSKDEDIPNPAATLRLFNAVRIDSGKSDDSQQFDADEAQAALDTLTMHRVDSCVRSGEQEYTVTIRTLFGDCTHVVRIPYQVEITDYRRRSTDPTNLPHGVIETRFPPEVPSALYDKVVCSSTGYAKGVEVPPNHKRTVILELLQQLASLDPALDPNS